MQPPRLDAADIRRAWGQRVRDARTAQGVTLEALAGSVGCCDRTVARWEAGRSPISVEQGLRIAGALEADPVRLFAWTATV